MGGGGDWFVVGGGWSTRMLLGRGIFTTLQGQESEL